MITEGKSYSNNSFFTNAFGLLRKLPVDLIQLDNSINHFDFTFRFCAIKSFEIFTLSIEFFDAEDTSIVEHFHQFSNSFNQAIVKVFIVDESVEIHSKIANLVDSIELSYVTVIGESHNQNQQYPQLTYFKDEHEFIREIKRDIHKINEALENHYHDEPTSISLKDELKINPNKSFISLNDLPGSNLAINNHLMLNQIIGNLWIDGVTKMADTNTPREKRCEEILNQSQKLDNLAMIMYNDVGVRPTDIFQPLLPALVLIFPYHYPKYSQLYGEKLTKEQKKWLSVSRSEQNLRYEHLIDGLPPEETTFIMHEASRRLNFLDSLGFFHARFSFSPVIRLPHIGKSINRVLSFLERSSSNRQTTIRNVKAFGEKLGELTITPELKEYLNDRNGQVFAISDMPIEWLHLDGLPFCFTHDVCRMPEFNSNAIVNSGIHLQRYLYEVPSDLLSKTLIIHCAAYDDVTMNAMFDMIDEYKTNFGFHTARCENISQIKKAIDDVKPDLIIFDCHGSSSSKDLSSFLVVNEKDKVFLTGDDIVDHSLSAPLVILSACSTMPNYGYVKLLSDAFMEAGAYSVTTTFLPIKVFDAAALIIRLLNKLYQLQTHPYHKNWLNLMSHVLRTSLIHETIRSAKDKLSEPITDEEIATILTKTMLFDKRKEALEDLDKLVTSRSKSGKLKLEQLDNDWLFYSIIGRADLLNFRLWTEAYRKVNMN